VGIAFAAIAARCPLSSARAGRVPEAGRRFAAIVGGGRPR